jgi:hypothetical protein
VPPALLCGAKTSKSAYRQFLQNQTNFWFDADKACRASGTTSKNTPDFRVESRQIFEILHRNKIWRKIILPPRGFLEIRFVERRGGSRLQLATPAVSEQRLQFVLCPKAKMS